VSYLVDIVLSIAVQGRPGDRELAELAALQHGVVARFQLLLLGFTRHTIASRVASGHLQPLYRGVYAVGHAKLSGRGHTMAAVLACGEDALASHRTAAELHGLLWDSRAVTDVSARGRRQRRRGIVLHHPRDLRPEDLTVIDGVPCTSVARTLLDLAATVPLRLLEKAFEEAERLGTFDLNAVRDVCGRNVAHRGGKKLRALIARTHNPPPFSRSGFEQSFFEALRNEGLPLPAVNNWVAGQEVDLYWSAQRLVVELDTRAFHAQRAAFETDRRRDARLQVAGNAVVRITDRRCAAEPAAVLGDIRTLLTARAQ
jgi:very-short-patch-repair endonuclease